MDLVARKKLNLEVLKRHDPNICDILDQSAHAVVYKFDTEKTSWEKLGYEGVIFLTQGKSAPYFGLYVLNRLSIENFSLHLTDFEEINLTDEFIIYQTSEGEACALWLFEKKDRERILAKILKLHEGMKALPSAQIPKPVESKVDILQMLKKASNTSPLETVGNDLLKALGAQPQQTQPQLPPQQPQQPQMLQQQPQMSQQQPQMSQQQPQMSQQQNIQQLQQLQQQQQMSQQQMHQTLLQQQQQQQLQQPFPMQPMMPPPPMHAMQQHANSPFTIPTSNCSERAGNRLQELFDSANNNNNNNNNNNMMHDNNNSNNNNNNMSRRVMANGELTKPFYPPFMNMSPAASPRNPGTLLQALHGGIPPIPPQQQQQQQHQQQQQPLGMPLMPQQVMGLMRPEVARRFSGRPILSKPEFIQQLLNMIQCDPTFFDVLYDTYQNQMGHS